VGAHGWDYEPGDTVQFGHATRTIARVGSTIQTGLRGDYVTAVLAGHDAKPKPADRRCAHCDVEVESYGGACPVCKGGQCRRCSGGWCG